jgi:ABC-type microcin C transport system duplicated ATPase subunit YejF
MSVLKVLTHFITSITDHHIRLDVILVIMSVSTFITAIILYIFHSIFDTIVSQFVDTDNITRKSKIKEQNVTDKLFSGINLTCNVQDYSILL